MSKPIKILHVFGRLGRGGAPMRTLDLLRHLPPKRYEFHFLTLSDIVGNFGDDLRALGGTIHRIPYGPVAFPQRFKRLLRTERFDVVQSHVFYQSGFILRLAAGRGVGIRIAHFRAMNDGRRASLVRRLQAGILRRWIDRYATHVLAVSEGAMESAWKTTWRSDSRCGVIYNGLEPSIFSGQVDRQGVLDEFNLPADCLFCIHVGRIVPEKNHLRLISVFRELLRHRREARLLLVGWDVQGGRRVVQERIAELGLEGQAILCGERTDVPRLLKAADVLVFPSLWEGLPGVVLEASAAGTPVLASDIPTIREIADRLSGVRLLSLDEPDEAWARAVEEIALGSGSEQKRREANRDFADSVFAVDRSADSICRVWQGLGSNSLRFPAESRPCRHIRQPTANSLRKHQ